MAKTTRRCADCKADISNRGVRAIRCIPCQAVHAKKPIKLVPRTCQHCGSEYMPRGALQKWCANCVGNERDRYRIRRYGSLDPTEVELALAAGVRASVCRTCAKEFTYAYVGGVAREFCDDDVPQRVASDRNRPPAKRPLNIPRECEICRTSFYPTHGMQKYCTTCVGNRRERARARLYGISRADLETLKAKFDGLCWLCREAQGTCVDHCHATEKVRGWLCPTCNKALHYVERPGWWEAAQAYLNG